MLKLSYFLNMLIILMFFILYIFIINYLHPMVMILMLMSYTILICLILSSWTFNFIYSIMLFMIMISGLLISFLYFASLISNMKNKYMLFTEIMLYFILNFLMMSFFLFSINSFLNSHYLNLENMNKIYSKNLNLFSNILYIYKFPYNNITLLIMFYLLLCLFLIIKVTTIKSAPLRKLNK